MADSNYYKNLYKQYEDKYDDYKSDIKELNKILDNVSNKLFDEINAVNKEIGELKEDLQQAIRHNDSFNQSQNSLQTEPYVNFDRHLGNVIGELEEEIRSLEGKKSQAKDKYDNYRQQYDNKKKEERAQIWGK